MSSLVVKLCGFTRTEDAVAAAQLGATALGFIFYAKSPRATTPETAREIITTVRTTHPHLQFVAVMVADDPQANAETFAASGCNTLQWHGAAANIPFAAPTFLVWRPKPGAPFPEKLPRQVSHILIDTFDPHLHGGTGRIGDWQTAATLAKHTPLILSGGLTADNITEAIRAVKPAGVDVASGIESAPGIKDRTKMQAFITAVEATRHV